MKLRASNKYIYICHSDTSWWFWSGHKPEQYFIDPDGWEPTENDTEGAALVAPHHILKWSDEDESV
jgi:hypothetical protein